MKKAEFLSAVVEKTQENDTPLSKKDIEAALDAILDTVQDALKNDKSVSFIGFGSFSTSMRAARETKVPGTDRMVKIPETKVAKFKAGKNLKEALNS
jgi:DNA-binding protein HU-beta